MESFGFGLGVLLAILGPLLLLPAAWLLQRLLRLKSGKHPRIYPIPRK